MAGSGWRAFAIAALLVGMMPLAAVQAGDDAATAPPMRIFVGEKVAVDRWERPAYVAGAKDGPSILYSARYRVIADLSGTTVGEVIAFDGGLGVLGSEGELPQVALIHVAPGSPAQARGFGPLPVRRTTDGDWAVCGWYQPRGMGPPPPIVPVEFVDRLPLPAPMPPALDGEVRVDGIERIDGEIHCRRGVYVSDLHLWLMREIIAPGAR